MGGSIVGAGSPQGQRRKRDTRIEIVNNWILRGFNFPLRMFLKSVPNETGLRKYHVDIEVLQKSIFKEFAINLLDIIS